ncbi:MAG TPA: 4'-phosphopantetheinyl transferase [Alcanivorax sp.]|jgi:enterobactin synthetase component D|nr:4'-phosphopantetheinyl transferase [Alcanivorax sp.]HAB08395.1 4'-phosphopantetheinyl transferase [Alcanivorax sp.]HAD63600.1 4'-phosphopantetheinyl transferase [Alcanivorax sp.]HAI25342.1 4'-phosphopantetheinyl transferase [Alcanivorax sp.]HAS28765.1 4'-phosphopantetheinyl transferase [Alcanivorax sp.]|tara:strand:+ start:1697 stop:2392 length:696 start_codon:yes stop_codon:yes gene_type:complete
MTDQRLIPPCLHDLDVSAWDAGLYLARCRFRPEQLRDNAFQLARVPEPDTLSGAIAKRRCEYLAGRVCAATAGQALTGESLIPALGKDRAPLWPAPLVGAITHSHGRAAALVGHRDQWQGLGLDYEAWLAPRRALRLAGEILTEQERQALQGLGEAEQARRITLTFSVKESLFKALYPLTGRRFYFQDAALDGEDRIRLLTTLSADWRQGMALPYQWRDDDGVLSWIRVPA